MDACEAVFSPHNHETLFERISTSICDSVCGEDLLVAIISEEGGFLAGNEQLYSEVLGDSSVVDSVLARIADGQDPVTFCTDDFGVVASQLRAGRAGPAFVVIGLKGYSFEDMAACSELTETLLNQINTIAGLIAAETSGGGLAAAGVSSFDSDRLICLN